MNAVRLFALTVVVSAAASGGFALGRQSHDSNVVSFVASAPAAAVVGHAVYPMHDDSVPDTADTLGHEQLRDEEAAPTF